ncbi:TetR/AcrR family transcriptional regulator [Hylemonella sp. W303a]|uniref:TetR/AcrR family transcriptional regulator n=1 Tax=Hylemonella sp. W303a TaxID=3389873 RepID=UPI00396B2936
MKSSPGMNASYHHGDLKTAVLSYALEQLERDGLESLSMREMAKAMGVSHTAAYRHFSDKRSLLDAVALHGFETLRQACLQAIAPGNLPRERLRACGLAYVRFGLAQPKLLIHMFHAVAQAEASPALTAAGAALFVVLRDLVEEGQRLGPFRAGDAHAAAHACWAMVHGLATLLSIGRVQDTSPEHTPWMDSAATSLDLFLDGLTQACSPSTPVGVHPA